MSSFLVNINLISICLRLLINLNTTSERDDDYIDKLRSKHVTATVFFVLMLQIMYIYNTVVELSTQQMS